MIMAGKNPIKNLTTVPLAEAKAKLSEIVRKVESGAEFEITKDGQRVARLVPIRDESVPLIGFLSGITLHDDLIAPAVSPDDWELS
jgi:prevent-host-death family protein